MLLQRFAQQLIHCGKQHARIVRQAGADHRIGKQLLGQQRGQLRVAGLQVEQFSNDVVPENTPIK